MQVNRVNNNTNNVNFKARPIVRIGDDFLDSLGKQEPMKCAYLTDEVVALINFFKRAAGNIGTDSDTLNLRSFGVYMFEITPNNLQKQDNRLPVYFLDPNPMSQMIRCIRILAKKLGDNNKIDLNQLCAHPYQDFLYQPDGGKLKILRLDETPHASEMPQELTVQDCVKRVKMLNTQA